MNIKTRMLTSIFALSCVFASGAHAQLSLPGFGGGSKGGAAPSPESIVRNYVEGSKSVLQAQEKLLLAIGKKEESATAALQASNLTENATKQQLENATKTQTENSKLIEESLNSKGTVLDAQAKATYAQGLGFLGKGVSKYLALGSDVKSFKPSVTSLGAAAQSAVYVAQTLPGNASSLSSTLSAAIKFGQEQGVDIPADATAALK